METIVGQYLFPFILFSVAGWALEIAYRSCVAGRFINPGLLKGPYLIIYGTAALVLMSAVNIMSDFSLPAKALVYLLVTTLFELGSGFASNLFSSVRLWDYSDEWLNYKGYICPKFSIYWVFLAFAFEYLILPGYQKFASMLPDSFIVLSVLTIFLFMLADIMIVIYRTLTIAEYKKTDTYQEFRSISAGVLAMPEVLSLANYPHHRDKTRLDHVMEVAYLSFFLGRKLNLDLSAIVKGALLHDLFYYDWRTEGPRLHGLRHHTIALSNAEKITELSKKERDIISKHMWPLTIIPPYYVESLLVCVVDTYCSVKDYVPFRNSYKNISRNNEHE
ncbi:metal dependent phosphohydrolase [Denitrovibrio acetiphilus DSM 12809]|jgi:uncharacterized protein|uniref:Metal dependent phosphohydrolase n=1 Tax=Denitrovibrio acetiphilus (strain DSM 12809 / NBRC 114555 / N2460) TaxID=522772 RepID=D4H8A9_DENA2|nr:HD domain-containing protein [Denitrovibrio acetiphilus]ADD68258.1 metal dependent phosphohydrolase [Denitrovibrio acetiphilus DSM 12809]